jgi:hypothetical protein
MKSKECSRRRFINQCTGHSAALLGAILLLNSCGGNNKDKPAGEEENSSKPTDPCNDFTGVSAEELDKRKRMAYIDKSEVPGSSCENCGLYIPWENQTTCGGCLLFKGPVHAEGHCTQWVAKA